MIDPLTAYDNVKWIQHEIITTTETGTTTEMVEAPADWSNRAVGIVANKYFRGIGDTRETSVQQLIERVVNTIIDWAKQGNYFTKVNELNEFHYNLVDLLVKQRATFNSPVWFNLGWEGRLPQTSACFLLPIEDSMESILDMYKTEGMIFKGGSGAGINLSTLRSSKEALTHGGYSSGPVSFMRGLDASAGSIKSGGSVRRAACLRILDSTHPDIFEFVKCKAEAEKKAHLLIDAGVSAEFNKPGNAYDTIPFQNANHSIRVTDAFMKAVINDETWDLKAVTTGETIERIKARDLWNEICEAAWICGDPGIQYHDTINRMNTVLSEHIIRTANPCSEVMFIDNVSCNLSSLNLVKYAVRLEKETWKLDIEQFEKDIRTLITAQDIFVDFSSYPTPEITQVTKDYRPLGLGYSNLGGLLVTMGIPYESEEGCLIAAGITNCMTALAYNQSSILAKKLGSFKGYIANDMKNVIQKHRQAATKLKNHPFLPSLKDTMELWDENILACTKAPTMEQTQGIRNSQVTLLAPAGTISFMMDCDTTGIEPLMGLVTFKKFAGGGFIKQAPKVINDYLIKHPKFKIEWIKHLEETGTLPDDLPEDACKVLMTAIGEDNVITPDGHLDMMAAVQPFLSGAISKTVGLPEDSTPEDVGKTYIRAWELGLKSVALYRDGSKKSQPVSTKKSEPVNHPSQIRRRVKLPQTRQSVTHKFDIGVHEGYLTVGLFDDGTPGEVFIRMNKGGSAINGMFDAFAIAVSLGLQYGVPLEVFVEKFKNIIFEPKGITRDPIIPFASSIPDFLARWLEVNFLTLPGTAVGKIAEPIDLCGNCGGILMKTGTCTTCSSCGLNTGCG